MRPVFLASTETVRRTLGKGEGDAPSVTSAKARERLSPARRGDCPCPTRHLPTSPFRTEPACTRRSPARSSPNSYRPRALGAALGRRHRPARPSAQRRHRPPLQRPQHPDPVVRRRRARFQRPELAHRPPGARHRGPCAQGRKRHHRRLCRPLHSLPRTHARRQAGPRERGEWMPSQ